MELVVESLDGAAVADRPFEIVERKGLGHPDTICDALAEHFSAALSRFYLDRFGLVLHHNVDKALLSAGVAEPAFGGGRILVPMRVYLAGRATAEAEGVAVPVEDLAVETTRAWFRDTFHALDPAADVEVRCLVHPGSRELVELFLRARESGVWLANDTSIGVGYAPLSPLERIVLEVERSLNSAAVKVAAPEAGEDIKVLGLRAGGKISLTIACAFIGRYLADLDAYLTAKERLAELAAAAARRVADVPVEVAVNAADAPESGDVYLTVSGTSAEAGDDGQVGRGNRVNGLITPFRPMTIEAAAGKNPVTHVGKLYNVAAGRVAAAAVGEIEEVVEAECYLLSRIGAPVAEPRIAVLRARAATGELGPALEARLRELAQEQIAGIGELWKEFVAGGIPVA